MNSNQVPADDTNLVSIEIPATLRHLSILCAAMVALCERLQPSVPESTIQSIELAIQEACTNIVLHAYEGNASGRIEMRLWVEQAALHIHLVDNGSAFDAEEIPQPHLDRPQESGYGVFLMHALMDTVEHYREKNQNHLRMTKQLHL